MKRSRVWIVVVGLAAIGALAVMLVRLRAGEHPAVQVSVPEQFTIPLDHGDVVPALRTAIEKGDALLVDRIAWTSANEQAVRMADEYLVRRSEEFFRRFQTLQGNDVAAALAEVTQKSTAPADVDEVYLSASLMHRRGCEVGGSGLKLAKIALEQARSDTALAQDTGETAKNLMRRAETALGLRDFFIVALNRLAESEDPAVSQRARSLKEVVRTSLNDWGRKKRDETAGFQGK